jgi:hypothetical protein
MSDLLDSIDRLNEIGIALSAESDTPKLLELIVMGAKSLTNAEGGSLYILMMVPARIMAIADIFEALTANDRPYKKGKKLSECLKIMGLMKQEDHIDPDIFEIFIKERVYMDYAEEFLGPEQIDDIDEDLIPGYSVSA